MKQSWIIPYLAVWPSSPCSPPPLPVYFFYPFPLFEAEELYKCKIPQEVNYFSYYSKYPFCTLEKKNTLFFSFAWRASCCCFCLTSSNETAPPESHNYFYLEFLSFGFVYVFEIRMSMFSNTVHFYNTEPHWCQLNGAGTVLLLPFS